MAGEPIVVDGANLAYEEVSKDAQPRMSNLLPEAGTLMHWRDTSLVKGKD